MWSIKEIPDATTQKTTIELDTQQFGKGFLRGADGQQKQGVSFFELKDVFGEEYITSQITNTPTLIAVTESQFNSWNSKKIIAKPCIFTANSSLIKNFTFIGVLQND